MIRQGQGRSTARVVVLIEPADATCFYKTWTGKTARSIHRAARARYAESHSGARVSFGCVIYTTSYGAH